MQKNFLVGSMGAEVVVDGRPAYYDNDCAWDAFLDEDLAAAQGFEGLQISFSSGLVLRIRCAVAEVTTV